MSSTTLALPSAGGAASACSPLNRSTATISSALRCVDMATNSFTTTTMMISKKSLFSPSSSTLAVAAACTSINNNTMMMMMMMMIRPTIGRHCCSTNPSSIKIIGKRRRRVISCEIALRSKNSATSSLSSSSVTVTEGEDEEEQQAEKKIGARVRVKVPLKVYHVPRVPEVDLTGKEGHLKQYVALWKGKRISANLPYKVEFVVDVEGRGPVKFFAHLKEDEFEYLE